MANDRHIKKNSKMTSAMLNDSISISTIEADGEHYVSLFDRYSHIFLTMEEWEETVKFIGKHRRDY